MPSALRMIPPLVSLLVDWLVPESFPTTLTCYIKVKAKGKVVPVLFLN
jgi:hypothetical protein